MAETQEPRQVMVQSPTLPTLYGIDALISANCRRRSKNAYLRDAELRLAVVPDHPRTPPLAPTLRYWPRPCGLAPKAVLGVSPTEANRNTAWPRHPRIRGYPRGAPLPRLSRWPRV
jgi:hypothetical protein